MKTHFENILLASRKLHVQQVYEKFEIILGFESRNKYRILDENMRPIAYAAEVSSGFLATLTRIFLKHWRSFEIHIFNQEKERLYIAHFPFRWFFKTLNLRHESGLPIGHLQQRFAIFSKKFSVYGPQGELLAEIKSPFFKVWTFEFKKNGRKLGSLEKKWSGALTEIFTDKDNFTVTFAQTELSLETKTLMMVTCLMVDIIYFENNQGAGSALDLID